MEQMVQAAIDGVGAGGYMDMGGGEKDGNNHETQYEQRKRFEAAGDVAIPGYAE